MANGRILSPSLSKAWWLPNRRWLILGKPYFFFFFSCNSLSIVKHMESLPSGKTAREKMLRCCAYLYLLLQLYRAGRVNGRCECLMTIKYMAMVPVIFAHTRIFLFFLFTVFQLARMKGAPSISGEKSLRPLLWRPFGKAGMTVSFYSLLSAHVVQYMYSSGPISKPSVQNVHQ